MPTISVFYGILIQMFWNEHAPPHFHALYGEDEALIDLRDPAAIGPLSSLMQTENDRKVPRTLIKHAIEACATSMPAADSAVAVSGMARPTISEPPLPVDSEREVIEI